MIYLKQNLGLYYMAFLKIHFFKEKVGKYSNNE